MKSEEQIKRKLKKLEKFINKPVPDGFISFTVSEDYWIKALKWVLK